MSSKQLHKHSVPIIALVFGMFAISAVGLQKLGEFSTLPSNNSASALFTSHVLTLKPTKYGWFQLSVFRPTASLKGATGSKPGATTGLSDAGRLAQLTLSFTHSLKEK